MSNEQQIIESNLNKDYEYGFVTDIESETLPPGLNENVIRTISKKKDEPKWLLDWRLKSLKLWKKMKKPKWGKISYPEIDYQSISYFSEPKKKQLSSLDEVDPQLLETYNKLGIPLDEQKIIPFSVNVSLKVVATDTESNTASTAIPFNLFCSCKGIPNFL